MALQPTGQLQNSAAPRIPGAEVGHSSVEIKQIEWPPTTNVVGITFHTIDLLSIYSFS